jgi:ADP-ribose pyrophosphatase YjhB (NUDIX family)
VDALVFRDGAVLLVKRGNEPAKGLWSPPGGSLELGETAERAAEREVLEETGLVVRARRVVDVRDVILRDPAGRVRWHYVLFGVLCEFISGEPFPGSDAENARFLALRELGEYDLVAEARQSLERVLQAGSS